MLSSVRPRQAGERAPLPPGFGAIWSSVAIDLVGFGIVLPLLPLYAERFGASATQVGLLVASFSIAQLLAAPVWGRVSDRYGRRPALLIGLAASAVSYVVFGFADSVWLLFASRVVQGAGGGTTGVAQAYVADTMEPNDRARALGWLSAATAAGVMVGPVIGSAQACAGCPSRARRDGMLPEPPARSGTPPGRRCATPPSRSRDSCGSTPWGCWPSLP